MKKRLMCICMILIMVFNVFLPAQKVDAKRVWVSGYTRKDGTRVKGHYRNIGGSNGGASSNTSLEVSNSAGTSNNSNGIFYKKVVNLYKYYDIVGTANVSDLVYVNGYYDKNGNYIRPHYRTYPNQYITDNFSYLGISTLKPLPVSEKYNYKYDSNKEVKKIETYLLYNISNNLNDIGTSGKSLINTYAKALYNNTVKSEDAITFYEKMGFNDWESNVISKYDISGTMTSDMYLYSVVNNYEITVNEEVTWIYNYYIALLNLYFKQEVSYGKFKNFAYNFYKYVGLPLYLIDEQIEMDLIQNFSNIDDFKYYENLVRNLVQIDLSYDWDNDRYNSNFESYKSVLYGITKYSDLDLYLSLYELDLEIIKNKTYSNTLVSIYYWGNKFYSLLGYSNELIKQEVQQDIILYFLN
ncbi:hypothetical protein [Lachnoclostridium sp.]|uniref:hypothetical protein n=1 Tax=Lachnoclostridium sp. TaxID=2028282 RepID=UPI00289FB741|nr:hypothetical protein [Lachnoclostridium sp.]